MTPLRYLLAALLVVLVSFTAVKVQGVLTDTGDYERNRTVLLYSELGSCTGTMILSPYTHKPYVLTAAHCAPLIKSDNTISAKTEDGSEYELEVLKLNPASDLMLLTNAEDIGFEIGSENEDQLHQLVHTRTWGAGHFPFYTDGEVVLPPTVSVNLCYTLECFLAPASRIMTTARVVPGSSGGPLLNEKSELIGIVQATDMRGFSLEASAKEIRHFLGEVY